MRRVNQQFINIRDTDTQIDNINTQIEKGDTQIEKYWPDGGMFLMEFINKNH